MVFRSPCTNFVGEVKIKKRRYIQFALALAVLVIVAGTLLVNSPRVQQRVSVLLAAELENRIGTRVSLGGVRWLFPNDIVVDSLAIDDQEGERLLSVNRLAVKVEWMPLIRNHRLSIRNVRLFHPDVHIYKAKPEDDYNYQFLIDAFATKSEKKPSRLSLRINTLLIRHAHVCHHVGSLVKEDVRRFNPGNLSIDDLSAQLSLKELSADSMSLVVRNMEFKERSGLELRDLYFRLVANRSGATLANFQLDLPQSTLRFDTVWASFPSADSLSEDLHEALVVKGKILPSTSYITPADLAPLLPQMDGMTEKVYLSADFIGSPSRINLKELDIRSAHDALVLRADAKLASTHGSWDAINVGFHEAAITKEAWALLADEAPDIYSLIPQELVRTGNIEATGNLHYTDALSTLGLQATTDAGALDIHLELDGEGHCIAVLNGDNVRVAQIVPGVPLTQTDIALQAEGRIGNGQGSMLAALRDSLTGTLTATATHTQFLGYEYDAIGLYGSYTPDSGCVKIALKDSNGALELDVDYLPQGQTKYFTVALQADTLDLHAMKLIGIHEDKTFSASLKAGLSGTDLDHVEGDIVVDNLIMHSPTGGDYIVPKLELKATESDTRMLALQMADCMNAVVWGRFSWHSLGNSVLSHLHHVLPVLCHSATHEHKPSDNLCSARIEMEDVTPLSELFLLPIELMGDGTVEAVINDASGELSLEVQVPQMYYGDNRLDSISLTCNSKEGGLILDAEVALHNDDGLIVAAQLDSWAAADNVGVELSWESTPADMFKGAFRTQGVLLPADDGRLALLVSADSACATINRSDWKLDPFSMYIAPEQISFEESLHITGDNTQHLTIGGAIARDVSDTLEVDFKGIDLGYLLSLVKLDGISFGGNMSGHADMASLYSGQPYIEGTVSAKDFTFCNGSLGNLDGRVFWNQDEAQLQFDADVWETPRRTTVIDGVVDLKRNELWLDIMADSTNVAFLNSMLGSFMGNIKGNASGHLIVGGPMDAIDLEGALMADAGFNFIPTGVDYHLKDSIRFAKGIIRFDNVVATDNRGKKAVILGEVTHKALNDYAYNLDISVNNLLGIKIPDNGYDSFYTTIYGTGKVNVEGSPTTPLTVNIQARPDKGSLFALNLTGQNASSSESFITFTDHTVSRNVARGTSQTSGRRRRARYVPEENTSFALNIMADITPDAELKLVMNQAADDHISVRGDGDLQISIDEDGVSLHGTYSVDHGSYRLSLQDVINKQFEVLSGSTVDFTGDPMEANLNITASHTVNYVPLKDLSPEMTGNVHVNCLLHIGNTLSEPTVKFELELPQGTEEEKAILRSYTGTEEQTNLQFIYLLGLGKFYTPDVAENAEPGGNGNMQSFISSTISGQINNLLSSIISNDNWNIVSNIRSDNVVVGDEDMGMENWENMEVEGILEGRLLDNRLLINGSFGYRDNPMYATNFIGDFDIRYYLAGGLSLKGYNKTNDRYFSRTSLTTQGVGLVFQRDFDRLLPYRKRKKNTVETTDTTALSLGTH